MASKDKDNNNLIKVEDLHTYFYTDEGVVKAVDGANIEVKPGEALGIIGESGCGKSVTALSLLRLIPQPPGRIVKGKILFTKERGETIDLTQLNPRGREIRSIRGGEISMIFQEPMTSLNPVYTIGNQIIEAIITHRKTMKKEARERAIEILARVGIPDPSQRVDEYPHQLSGGMRQRVMIAMALSCNPKLLIADEPTTALDVTIQAQILELMKELQQDLGMAIMIITHNMGIISEMSHRVVVMYLGQVVEHAEVHQLFREPKHPYTKGLLNSIPVLGAITKEDLEPIKGSLPDIYDMPSGCRFANRCPYVIDICAEEPPLFDLGDDHLVKCWLYSDESKGEGN